MNNLNGKIDCLKNNIFYFKMKKEKLFTGHTYVIIENGTNVAYYGKCHFAETYLFSDIKKYGLQNEYIGFKHFSEKDTFLNTHTKID